MKTVLVLLLIAQASAEWVEISQHHYRKPIRTHSPFTTPDKVINVEDASKPWAYNNRSVTEYNWNKNPARPQNTANVKRVQLFGTTVKTTERVKFEEYPELDVDVIDYELRPNNNYGPPKTTTEFIENGQKTGTIERVPNLGNIKRVQLSDTPVKSPAINFKGAKGKYSSIGPNNTPRDENLQTETNEFENRRTTEPFVRRIYVNNGKNYGTERTATFPPDNEDTIFAETINTLNKKGLKQEYKNYTTLKHIYSSTIPTFITESEDFRLDEYKHNNFYKFTNRKTSDVTEKIKTLTTESVDIDEDIFSLNNVQITNPTTEKTAQNKVYQNVIKGEIVNEERKPGHIGNGNLKSKNTDQEQNSRSKNGPHKENAKGNKDKKDGRPNKAKTENIKMHTLENVIKFMRVVADTISTNSRRSFGGKMQYLHELKDTILANIAERIDSTWPDDSEGARRYSRSAQASPRGHVHIPSSESALMTISFLTFAVFLIKLVLQVIQTYKHKAMMYAPVVVAAAGRNVFTRTHHGHS